MADYIPSDRPTLDQWLAQAPQEPAPPVSYADRMSPYVQDAAEAAAARVRAPYARANARESGLPSLLEHYGEKAKSVLTAPQRALTGELQVNDPETNMPTREAIGEAGSLAGILAGGGMPMAERGALGMFGGKPTYSAAAEAVRTAKLQTGTPDQWLGYLKNYQGVKPSELEEVGLEPWLKNRYGKVTREEINQYIDSKQPQIQEVRKGQGPTDEQVREYHDLSDDAWYGATERQRDEMRREVAVNEGYEGHTYGDTKYSSYQLPGGSNYGETLLTLPSKLERKDLNNAELYLWDKMNGNPREKFSTDDQILGEAARQGFTGNQDRYLSSHWDEPNVLLHVRHNDRAVPGPNGEPLNSLHLEEVQSDWHQAGRKNGYREADRAKIPFKDWWDQTHVGNFEDAHPSIQERARQQYEREGQNVVNQDARIPDAPFKQTWPDLALKRMLHRAATETNADGTPKYHALSWTPGEAQAARYDLSKHLDSIGYEKRGDNLYNVAAYPKKGNSAVWRSDHATLDDIERNLGKEMAEKISNGHGRSEGRLKYLEDLDLKVGGEGMKAFYDKMLVDKANALTKKYGAKVQQSAAEGGGQVQQMREPAGWQAVGPRNQFIGHFNSEAEARNALKTQPVHVLRITPELRAAAVKGFPTFAIGGAAALGAARNRNYK
jgi:hypothetical protein